jgi:RimJ/RimL family protein N-acetyltransferase
MDVTIRRISSGDVEGFHRALDFVARERRYLALLEAPPLEMTREFITNIIANGHVQFVAVSGNDVVGWCDILPENRPAHAHSGTLGMGLLPQFRGKGLGFALIKAALGEARHKGLVRVELTVNADNARAIALYKKVGFKIEGLMRDAVLIDGDYKDLILMAIVDRSAATPDKKD